MIEALLVFGSMLIFLWVLRALDTAFRSKRPPQLGLFELEDGHQSVAAPAPKNPTPGGNGHA